MEIEILSVNVGQPQVLATQGSKEVLSSIAKKPVGRGMVHLSREGLMGNQQSNTQIHGGVDMAVYAYPSEHFTLWSTELDQPIGPASFGENLTIAGIIEAQARIGDIWQWGSAQLQITSYRGPCFKLALYRGVPDMVVRMRQNGRCGWYLRVLETGFVPTYGTIQVIAQGAGATIAEVFEAKYGSK